MNSEPIGRSPGFDWQPWLIGAAACVVATVVRKLFDVPLGDNLPYITYFVAVAIASWRGGWQVGFATLIACVLLADYFFIEPRNAFGLNRQWPQLNALLFLVAGGVIVFLSDLRLKQSRRIAELLAETESSRGELEHALGRQQGLAKAEAQLAAIVTSSADAIFSRDMQGVITSWNQGAERLFGYAPAEIIGKPLEVLIPAEERERTATMVKQVEQGKSLQGIEVQRLRKDGSRVEVALTLSPIYAASGAVAGVAAVARDISESKLTERALAESEAKFRAVAETATTAIYIHDGKQFIYVNPAAERITGYTREELYSLDIWRLVHPDFAELVKQRAAARFQGLASPDRYEYKIVTKKGEEVWLDFGGTVIEYAGKRCILATAFDVTARKQAEEALIRSEKLASAGRLAATIAHEINNPLEAVTNLLYLARTNPDKAAEFLSLADVELQRITHIARQTLGFYRESGAPHTVDVEKVVRNVVELYDKRIEAKNIFLDLRLREGLSVLASSGELRQIVSNLMANALDALPPSGRLSVRACRCRDPRTGVYGARLTVADNAGGIPAELRPRIFDAFFTTKSDVGTGLGLWVTRNLVEKHGGRLRMRSSTSAAGHGTVFTVFFSEAEKNASDEAAA